MPLVKRNSPTDAPLSASFADHTAVMAALAGSDPVLRRDAAMAAHDWPGAVYLLANAIQTEKDRTVAEAMVLALVQIGGPEAAAALVPLLRADDAALRFSAAEALRDLGSDARAFFDVLIRDSDPQVRIIAAEIARGPLGPSVGPVLEGLLLEEEEVNVACAFIDVLTEIGTASAAPALRAFAARFPEEPYVRFTVDTALTLLPNS